MPELPEVYPTPPTPPDERDIPRFAWEDHPAFRFSFLMHFTQDGDRAALEHLGKMLYDMALEVSKNWPGWKESTTRAEMRAVARDLQHAALFLQSVSDERKTVSLDHDSERFTFMAESWSLMVGQIAQGIEDMLGPLYDREGNRL